MKNSAIWILTFIMMVVINMSSVNAADEEKFPTVSIRGEGTIEVAPDRATISISVQTQDKDASRAQVANAKAAQEVINSIVALGVDRKYIHTSDYSFRPTYRQEENRRNEINGYVVNNTVYVVLDNLELVGKVIDASLSNGANNINSLDFGVKDRKKLQDDALILAIRDARQRADLVARELGRTVIGIQDISVNTGSVDMMRANSKAYAMIESADYATPIEAGTLSCSASVNITFILSK